MSKRRTFAPEFKAQVVLEEPTGVKDKAEICREYRLRPQVFSRWRGEFLERAPEIFATTPSGDNEQERIAELERMVGRLKNRRKSVQSQGFTSAFQGLIQPYHHKPLASKGVDQQDEQDRTDHQA